MEVLIDALNGALPSIASVAVITMAGLIYHKVKNWHGEHGQLVDHLDESEKLKEQIEELIEQNRAQSAGLREIIGRWLDQEHKRLVEQGYATPEEKAAFEKNYMIYHDLGGNGTRTALYEDVMKMNSYPKKEDQK